MVLHDDIITWEMNNRPTDGRSSETKSYPIDIIIIVLMILKLVVTTDKNGKYEKKKHVKNPCLGWAGKIKAVLLRVM
jgi:hypothetical protein